MYKQVFGVKYSHKHQNAIKRGICEIIDRELFTSHTENNTGLSWKQSEDVNLASLLRQMKQVALTDKANFDLQIVQV